jgi:hypothetical protein
MATKESINELLNDVDERLAKLMRTPERYQSFLKTISKFHIHGPENAVIIHTSMPEASLIQTKKGWGKHFERKVLEDSSPLEIIQYQLTSVEDPELGLVKVPSYALLPVYDLSQTEGKDLDLSKLTPRFSDKELLSIITDLSLVEIETAVFDVREKRTSYFDVKQSKIMVSKALSEHERLLATLHEVTHIDLATASKKQKKPMKYLVDTEDTLYHRRFIQDSYASALCEHWGLEPKYYNFDYITDVTATLDLPERLALTKRVMERVGEILSNADAKEKAIVKQRDLREETPAKETTIDHIKAVKTVSLEKDKSQNKPKFIPFQKKHKGRGGV